MKITRHIASKNQWFIQEEPVKVHPFDGDIYYLNEYNHLHREDGPAYVSIYNVEEWYWDGLLHREDGPAHTSGVDEQWWIHGKKHRIGGPAEMHWFQKGMRSEHWYREGLLHREDGPAVTDYTHDGSTLGYYKRHFSWYLFGKYISLKEEIRDNWKWLLLKGNIENIKIIKNPTQKMQQYVIFRRPDLINFITNMHPKIRERYQDELAIAGMEI